MIEYTAEVRDGLLLALPAEAQELHLVPGAKVQVQLCVTKNGTEAMPYKPRRSDRAISPAGKPKKRVSAMGKYAGIVSSDDCIRQKKEDIELEERRFK